MSTPAVTDFATALPPPLTSLIIELAPFVSWLKWSLKVITWRGEASESWLMLAAWWGVCLFGKFVLSYLTPLLLLLPLLSHARKPVTVLSTEETILHTLEELTELKELLILSKLPPIQYTLAFPLALRLVGLIYVPFLLLVFFTRTRVLVAICGTVVLCWRSWWFQKLGRVLWSSAWVRVAAARAWSLASGEPLPIGLTIAKKGQGDMYLSNTENSTELKILFTISENQRWWMGLDWTAALLPSERPSWSTIGLQPSNPPSTFSLPPSATSYLPHPSNSNLRIQRKAIWRWEESEWKVVINLEGAPSDRNQRIAKPLPTSANVQQDTSKLKQMKDVLHPKEKEGGADTETSPHDDQCQTESCITDFTDADGWSYGDNTWEKMSARGGIGKYTRCRRWTRVAAVREERREVGPGELGVVRSAPIQTGQMDLPRPDVPVKTDQGTSSSHVHSLSPTSENGEGAGDRLRQRLKAAVRATTVAIS